MHIPRHILTKANCKKKPRYILFINFQCRKLATMHEISDPLISTIIEHYFDLKQAYKCIGQSTLHALTRDNMQYYMKKEMKWCLQYLKQNCHDTYSLFTDQQYVVKSILGSSSHNKN